jgi:hypothetical protein
MEKMNIFNFDKRPLFVIEFEKQNEEFIAKVKRSKIKKMEKILFENRYSDKIFDVIINSQDNYEDLREKLAVLLEERRQILEKELKRI